MGPAVTERERMDVSLADRGFTGHTRDAIWASATSILSRGPLATDAGASTGLALGYVQSGKTTAITALIAAAADAGYRIVVAMLGSTNLLLDQNQERLATALGLDTREDYRWVSMPNVAGVAKAKELKNWLARDRTLLLPVLKHPGRIEALAKALAAAGAAELPVLIVDDEADQASLLKSCALGDPTPSRLA